MPYIVCMEHELDGTHTNVHVRIAADFTARAERERAAGDLTGWAASLEIAAQHAIKAAYPGMMLNSKLVRAK